MRPKRFTDGLLSRYEDLSFEMRLKALEQTIEMAMNTARVRKHIDGLSEIHSEVQADKR